MSRFLSARLALFLLVPLVAVPGLGYDALRLPVALGLAGIGFALRKPSWVFATLAAFVLLQFSAVYRAPLPFPGGIQAMISAVGLSAYAAARATRDRRPLPWILSGLGAALGIAAAFGREGLEGNPNYAGAVAALLIPPLAALAGGEGGRLRLAALAGLAGAAFALLASESRGGLLAALAGLGVVALLALKRGGRRQAALPVAAALLLLAVPLLFRTARFVSAERMATASVRTEIWKGAGRLALDRPWGGSGTGGFAAEFPPYRSAVEAAMSYRDALPGEYREVEDAHSTWMHVLAETGFPGLLLLLAAVGLAVRVAVRSASQGPLEAGLAGLVAAFLVAATFNTLHTHVSPWILFWIAVGLLEGPAAESKAWPAIVALALAVCPGAALARWGLFWNAERSYRTGLTATDREDRIRALKDVGAGPRGWEAQYRLGAEALAGGDLQEAESRFERASLLRRHHGGAIVNWAVVRLRRGVPRSEVERMLVSAKSADPTYFAIDFNLGNLAALDGRWAEARERYRSAQSLHPRHAGSAYGEGAAWLAEGKVEEALPALRRARELGMDVDVALKADFPALSADPRLR